MQKMVDGGSNKIAYQHFVYFLLFHTQKISHVKQITIDHFCCSNGSGDRFQSSAFHIFINSYFWGPPKNTEKRLVLWFKYAILQTHMPHSLFSFAPFLQTCNYWLFESAKKWQWFGFNDAKEDAKNSKFVNYGDDGRAAKLRWILPKRKPLKLRSSRWNALYRCFDFEADSKPWQRQLEANNDDDNDDGEPKKNQNERERKRTNIDTVLKRKSLIYRST